MRRLLLLGWWLLLAIGIIGIESFDPIGHGALLRILLSQPGKVLWRRIFWARSRASAAWIFARFTVLLVYVVCATVRSGPRPVARATDVLALHSSR